MTYVVDRAILPDVKLLDRLEKAIEHGLQSGRADSERALSRLAGLSDGYLGRTKSGMRANPSYDPGSKTLSQIANACGVRVEWLAAEQGSMLESTAAPQLSVTAVPEWSETKNPLDALVEEYEWPAELTMDEVRDVIRNLRSEYAKSDEPLPKNYLRTQIPRYVREVQGRPKLAYRRAPEPVAVGDGPSPERLAQMAERDAKKKKVKNR